MFKFTFCFFIFNISFISLVYFCIGSSHLHGKAIRWKVGLEAIDFIFIFDLVRYIGILHGSCSFINFIQT